MSEFDAVLAEIRANAATGCRSYHPAYILAVCDELLALRQQFCAECKYHIQAHCETDAAREACVTFIAPGSDTIPESESK